MIISVAANPRFPFQLFIFLFLFFSIIVIIIAIIYFFLFRVRKTREPAEKPSDQGREQTTNSTYMCGVSSTNALTAMFDQISICFISKMKQCNFPSSHSCIVHIKKRAL